MSACTSIPISTLWALRNIQLDTLDASQLRAALRLPADVQLKPASLRLEIEVRLTPPNGGDPVVLKENLRLERLTQALDLAPLLDEEKRGTTLSAYQVAPSELIKLAQLRQKVAATPRVAGKSLLSLGLHFEGCRPGAAGRPLVFSSYLRPHRGSEYLPVLKDANLAQLLSPELLAQTITPCGP